MEPRAASPEISWADVPPLGVIVAHELETLERLGVLEWGEILVEVEQAFRRPDDEAGKSGPGALIVTDLQILFIATSMPRRRIQHLIRIPLAQVVGVDSTVHKCALRRRPTVEIEARLDGGLQTFAFPLWVRSGPRADEIARSIVRERRWLAMRRKRRESAPTTPKEHPAVGVSPTPKVNVYVGRRVTDYVRVCGGRLYVWSVPVGAAFDTIRASVQRPPGHDFDRCESVRDFDLFIEPGPWSSKGFRLTRRWWGLRDGISVDTGLALDGGS